MDNIVEVDNIVVENLIIKLSNDKELKLKVSLEDWMQPMANNAFKINLCYKDHIENALNDCVDNESVKYHDKIDHKAFANIRKIRGWKKEDFKFDTAKHSYIINNMLCVDCFDDRLRHLYYIDIHVPTTRYSYIKDMISFEVRGFPKPVRKNISDFISPLVMSSDKADEFRFDCIGTYLRILNRNSTVIIQCTTYYGEIRTDMYYRDYFHEPYTLYLQSVIEQCSKKIELLKRTIDQVKKIGTKTTELEDELDDILKKLLFYELIQYIGEDENFRSCKDKKSRRIYLSKVLQEKKFTQISDQIKGGKNLYILFYKNNALTYHANGLFRFLDMNMFSKIEELETKHPYYV